MKTIEYRTKDKTEWGEGPWLKQMIEDAPAGSMSNVRPDAGCPTCGARSSAIGALAWVELPYDETEWSSEPREGEVHWLTDEVLVIVKDKKLWRIELPKIPSASTDGKDHDRS